MNLGHRVVRFLLVLLLLPATWAVAQDEWRNLDSSWFEEIFPAATRFSEKLGQPPVVSAFAAADDGEETLLGYLFTTPDLPPEEIGFSGPIDVLVGIDLDGKIVGTRVLFYLESYKNFRGDFIADSGFTDQLNNKPIADEFRVGQDIDGMARATISSWALARGVRNAARRVAEAYLPDTSYVSEASVANTTLQNLQSQSWEQYRESGFVKELTVPIADQSNLNLAFAYMGHYRLGELLIGANAYSNADRTASGMIEDGHMLLIGLSGNVERLQQLRLGIMQDGKLYPNRRDRVVFAGIADAGKITGQARRAIAMYIDADVDITRAFTVVYDIGERSGEFAEYTGVDYELPAEILALVTGEPIEVLNNETFTSTVSTSPNQELGRLVSIVLVIALVLAIGIRLRQRFSNR